jgi:heme-degrading monooxygenase HmoA
MVADKNARERKGGHTVHIQIITFGLKGIREEGYAKGAEAVAPTIAAMPGLLSKHWLADKETNTYGGAYVWRDREAMEAYGKTEVFAAMRDNPHLEGLSVKDYAVLEEPTRITRGLAEARA